MPSLPDIQHIKQQFPLLEFLQRNRWQGHPANGRAEIVGLCPFHSETRPSFYVNSRKNLFYCHSCGRGGDLIRFLQFSRGLSFPEAVHFLVRLSPPPSLLSAAAAFFQQQLPLHPEALAYLALRGLHDSALIQTLGIGYAPGGNLRAHLTALGFSLSQLFDCGLIDLHCRDTFYRRVIFPCRDGASIVNFYGRSTTTAFPHRLLPGSKGTLFPWDSLSRCFPLLLVEGLFDLAVLWQAGFRNTTCAIGTHLTSTQLLQLSHPPGRTVYIVFDQDANGAGQRAAHCLARRLENAAVAAPIVRLPANHDPNSYFVAGATAADFSQLLTAAQRL